MPPPSLPRIASEISSCAGGRPKPFLRLPAPEPDPETRLPIPGRRQTFRWNVFVRRRAINEKALIELAAAAKIHAETVGQKGAHPEGRSLAVKKQPVRIVLTVRNHP